MRNDLRDALWNDFPTLFEGVWRGPLSSHEITKDEVGFWCGDGWEPIVRKALERLAKLSPTIQVGQVKEKLSSLTVHFSSPSELNDQCMDIIAEAKRAAESTCEECGCPGVMRDGDCLQTLCDEHGAGRRALCRTCEGRVPRLSLPGGVVPQFCPDCNRQVSEHLIRERGKPAAGV